MEIKRIGSERTVKGPVEYFTGTVRIDPLFEPPDPARMLGASVTFEPSARTAWHTHPLPKIICHTMSSIDGRLLADRWTAPAAGIDADTLRQHYEQVAARFDADGWIVGRKTME